MNNTGENQGATAPESVRKYLRDVVDGHQLPSLPVVAGKVLEMIQDPDINAQKLCRVLADDAALTARVLSVSRSPYFAQRILPTNLISAVQVLGFQNLRNIVVANATHSLFVKGNPVSEKLWNHSLAVALAMRILFQRAGIRTGDLAFLTGLMHDLGEMIMVHGDPVSFAELGQAVEQAQCQMMDKEQEFYGFDHTLIGLTLLDSWNIDSQIGRAVLNHHSDVTGDSANELAAMLAVADYLCCKAGLGFFATPPMPTADLLTKCGCDNDEGMGDVVQTIREAYNEESALFKPS